MADEFLLRKIDHWRRLLVPHRWQMVPTGMATTVVVPVGPSFPDVAIFFSRVLSENVLSAQAWGTPALADGRIYLRTVDYLYCIEDQSEPAPGLPPVR